MSSMSVDERLDRIEDMLVQIIKGNAAYRAESKKQMDEFQDSIRGQFLTFQSKVQEQIDALRTEIHEQIGTLRAEMQEQIGALRAEMHEQIGALRAEMHEQVGSLRAELHNTDAKLSGAIEAMRNDLMDYIRDSSFHERQLSIRVTRVENRVAEIAQTYRPKE